MPRRAAPVKPPLPRRYVASLWGAGLALVLGIHLLRLDEVCGLYSDDGWYVLLAKALATGHGYTLINGPTPGVVPYFPPGFPWLLSFVFRVAPAFPANVWLLKSISIVAMLGIAVLAQRYAAREGGLTALLAAAVALATALHPGLVFLATSTVMSEPVFTLVQLAIVLLVERLVRRQGPAWAALGIGCLAGFAFLLRSVGATLVLAGGLYLTKERRWRAVAAYALGAAVVAGPWMLFARTHIPTLAQRAEMNDAIALPYTEHFWLRATQDLSLGVISASELPARMWDGLQTIGGRVIGGLEFYPLYHLLDPGMWAGPVAGSTAISVAATIVVTVGFIAAVRRRIGFAEILTPLTILLVALWGASPFRLVLPLLPFILCYTVLGIRTAARAVGAGDGNSTALAAMVLVVGVSLASHVAYVGQVYGPRDQRPVFVQLFEELLDVITWARDHVPADQVVASIDPAMGYLYSGHRTIGYNEPEGAEEQWRRLGVHFLIETSYLGHLSTLPEGRFKTVHRSPQLGMRVLDLERIYAPAP